jgi:predicted phosphate transport protein (TIGR00153 family)
VESAWAAWYAKMKIFPKKKPSRFLELLLQQAEYSCKGWQTLLAHIRKPESRHAEAVLQLEKEADEVRRILIDELNRTFVTPLDREDIFALSLSIDDVLDYANTTIDEMTLLHVEPNTYIERMVSLLADAAQELNMAVQHLQGHPAVAVDHAIRAKALENRVEAIYREALADLFHRPMEIDYIVEMLKLRELYRHLSNAADRGDEAANVIGDIVVKIM